MHGRGKNVPFGAFLPKAVPLVIFPLLLAVGFAGWASASQNRPSWSSGDFWNYVGWGSGSNITQNTSVLERTSLTIGATTYTAWHAMQNTSRRSGGTMVTIKTDLWVMDGDLGLVRSRSQFPIGGNTTVTYDPPRIGAVFPLRVGTSWSRTTNQTTETMGGTFVGAVNNSGTVVYERDVTVPAGTFPAAAIKLPQTGVAYIIYWYAERVGNFVAIDSYRNTSTLAGSLHLTAYRYEAAAQGPSILTVGIPVLAVASTVVVFKVLRRRRRTAMTPPPHHRRGFRPWK